MQQNSILRAVVVSQLVEQLFPIPEIRSSNPVIGNIIFYQLNWKAEMTKRPGMAQFLNKQHFLHVIKCRKQTYIQYNV